MVFFFFFFFFSRILFEIYSTLVRSNTHSTIKQTFCRSNNKILFMIWIVLLDAGHPWFWGLILMTLELRPLGTSLPLYILGLNWPNTFFCFKFTFSIVAKATYKPFRASPGPSRCRPWWRSTPSPFGVGPFELSLYMSAVCTVTFHLDKWYFIPKYFIRFFTFFQKKFFL